jgi:CO/xanthine dehydrogenase Mo-binding subunit
MNRRQFLKAGAHAGAGVILIRYMQHAEASFDAKGIRIGTAFVSKVDGQGRIASQRYDGSVKVTGGKIYGVDFRAKDMDGWPTTERRAIILRTPISDRIFTSLDKKKIIQEFGVSRIVTGDDIVAWGSKGAVPFLMPEFYVPSHTAPYYLGQPLALLIFNSTDDFLSVKDRVSTLSKFCEFGAITAPRQRSAYGSSRFVRYLNKSGDEEYSFIKSEALLAPAAGLSDSSVASNKTNSHYINKIQQDLASSDWSVFEERYFTQSVDPMFMEPECGLAWYEQSSQTLNLTLGTQSPYDDGIAISNFFRNSKAPGIKKIVINCCFPGGGFGGRDSSDFPLHLAIAALSEPNVSHRIVHTRPDQFQGGIKRHPATIDISLAVDSSGQFQVLHNNIKLDGGGQNNYSFAVQSVAARNSGAGYRFPRSWVDATAFASTAIPSGSMRGFGSFQSSFALECLIDVAAANLNIDAIDLRKKNAVVGFENIQTGVTLAHDVHVIDVLEAASISSLWRDRKKNKLKRSSDKVLYGTGFSLGVKTFGKGDDACLAGLLLDENGQLLLMTNGIDMGNGSATTLPLSLIAVLGRPADGVQIGVTTEFEGLQIFDSVVKDEAEQKRMALNPLWVPLVSMSTAASTSAYELRHSVLEAGNVLLRFGLWPAAASIMQLNPQAAQFDPKRFTLNEDALVYKDGRSILFIDLASKAHELGLVTGVMVHAFYRIRWAKATFPIEGETYTSQIDALAIRKGDKAFNPILRSSVDFPPWAFTSMKANRMSSYAVVLSVEVNKESGEVNVVDAMTFLECGPPILEQIVQGQMEGAFAMGIGQALTEDFPAEGSEGPGSGGWNLNRYDVPLARHCALGHAQFNILASRPHEDPKGMSEVVFNPVPAAIVNAVADATGMRLTSLPLTAKVIKAAIS